MSQQSQIKIRNGRPAPTPSKRTQERMSEAGRDLLAHATNKAYGPSAVYVMRRYASRILGGNEAYVIGIADLVHTLASRGWTWERMCNNLR